eukprot:363678-Chlamydomonas_euryale.AAC.3
MLTVGACMCRERGNWSSALQEGDWSSTRPPPPGVAGAVPPPPPWAWLEQYPQEKATEAVPPRGGDWSFTTQGGGWSGAPTEG